MLQRTGSDVNDTTVHAFHVFVVNHAGVLPCTGCMLNLSVSVSVQMPAVLLLPQMHHTSTEMLVAIVSCLTHSVLFSIRHAVGKLLHSAKFVQHMRTPPHFAIRLYVPPHGVKA